MKGHLIHISDKMNPLGHIAIDLMIASKDGEFQQTRDCRAILVMVDLKKKKKKNNKKKLTFY